MATRPFFCYNSPMVLTRLLAKIRQHFFSYQSIAEVFIYKNNIIHNYRAWQNYAPGNMVAPVLKSNAYGHGLVAVAQIVAPLKPPFLILDSIFEARRLRAAGIKTPLLIIGYTAPENILKARIKNAEFAITAIETLEFLSRNAAKPIRLHLKFDTGMHRQGIALDDAPRAKLLVSQNQNLKITGIFSHLADADNSDTTNTQKQISVWNKLVGECRRDYKETRYFHLAATYGTAFAKEIDGNMVRLGIGLYGLSSSIHFKDILQKPALEFKTIITSVRNIGAGERVGYNETFTATKPTVIATIPVGYFEVVDRRLSNVGSVGIDGVYAPIAGRVSMNITSLDVSAIKNPYVGQTVTVIGLDVSAPNSLQFSARLANTITYELAVHIPAHLKRTVV